MLKPVLRLRARLPVARLVLGLMAAAAAISLAAPSVVLAHAEYDRSNPPSDAPVPEAPERLDVWFTQELFRREGANALEVTNEAGERVDADDLLIDDADRRHASVGLPPDLPAGTYTVFWRTLSATDGDAAEGTFEFTIDPAAAPATPTASPEATSTGAVTPTAVDSPGTATPAEDSVGSGGAAFPWWALIAGLGIAAAGVASAWAIRMEEPAP